MSSASLQHIFENPLPENPTLLESLSWSQKIKPVKSIDHSSSSFTEIFGELHFKESPQSPPPPPSPSLISEIKPSVSTNTPTTTTTHANSNKSSSLSCQSLHLCTEGLGFESSDDTNEELKMNWETQEEEQGEERVHYGEWKSRSTRVNGVKYPPPISCIRKPWVSFRSYRDNGRFVLKEIRIPTQDFLHAHREDGRLMLHFVQPPDDEEFLGEDEEQQEDSHEEEEEEEEEEEKEEYDDGVESMDGGEENMGKESHSSVTDQVN